MKRQMIEEWREYSGIQKVGLIIHYLLLILFIIWLFYFGIFSKDITLIKELLKQTGTFYLFYFTSLILGLYVIAMIYYKIVYIFHPKTNEEKNFLKKLKGVHGEERKILKLEKEIYDLKNEKIL